MTDALLFDYNGVIVDDEPLHFEAFRRVLAEQGLPLDRATYDAEYLGLDDRACFRAAFRRAGRTVLPDEVGRAVRRKSVRYRALAAGNLTLVPGVGAFVRRAAERARIAVVSGSPRSEIAMGLDCAGIADLVSVIVSAEDVVSTKPDPTGYRLALGRLRGADRAVSRAAVIEDSLPGLAAARALGLGCAMLATSHPASKLEGADAVWESFEGHRPEELDLVLRPVADHASV